MNWEAIFWFVLLVGFLLVEAGTVTVVSMWFAAGSLAAMIVSFLSGPLWLQFVIFAVVSALLLWMLRPIIRKHFKPRITATNVDAMIGKIGVTIVPVNNVMAQGKLMVNGMEWSARSTSGEEIPENVQVRIDRVEGVKLYVTPVEVLVKQ